MDTYVANYLRKLETLLGKVLEGKRDENLDLLASKLREKDIESVVVALPLLTQWLKKAVATWTQRPSDKVAAFALTVAGLLSKKESTFCLLNTNNFFIKLVNVLKARQATAAPSTKLAYIELLSSFLEHHSGIEWTIACNFWEDVYVLGLAASGDDVVKESTRFLSKMLEKTVAVDEGFVDTVVKKIMLPLGENIYKSIKASDDVSAVRRFLKPTLALMGDILGYFLEGMLRDDGTFHVAVAFLKNFHLEERVSDFMIIAQTKCLAFDIGKIMFIMQFLELYVKVLTNSVSVANANATIKTIKNNFIMNISKGTFEDVVEFCHFGQLYWKVIESKIALSPIKRSETDCTDFSNQLVIMEILPHFVLLMKYCYGKDDMAEMMTEDLRDSFISKMFSISCHDFVRACYHWRDAILPGDDLFEICRHCNHRIKESRHYISRQSAVIVVQSFIYNLKDVVHFCKESQTKFEYFANQVAYFCEILELLPEFIERFEVTWKDSIESIDLLSISFEFLMLYRWPRKVAVLVLKLIRVAIAKYMAPNLALLVDNTSDSTIALMGPLLFAKLYDPVGEMKEAALGVVRTMAWISKNSE